MSGTVPVNPADHGVAVVTVTYGNRAQLCIASMTAASAAGVRGFVVVANGVTRSAAEALTTYANDVQQDVEIIEFPENQGSASGFARGIATAQRKWPGNLIWILDDDNVPADDCLSALLAARRSVPLDQRDVTALLAFRPAIPEHAKSLAYGTAYPPPSSFLYLDVSQRARSLFSQRRASQAEAGLLRVPYGPYGGLLISSSLIDSIGLPDETFVLYEDDTDYTARISAVGGKLLLCLHARIEDAGSKWSEGVDNRLGPARLLRSNAPSKLYYSTRNRLYFEWRRPGRRKWRFCMNGAVYVTALLLSIRRLRDLRSAIIIMRAATDGITGKLGTRSEYPLADFRHARCA